MTCSVNIRDLTWKETRWALQRLFPYPEDMGPFESDRYNVFIGMIDAGLVTVHPMPLPSSEIFYMELYEKT